MTVKVWTFVFSTLLLVTGCSKSEVVTTYEQEVAKQEYVKQQPTQQEVNNSPVPVVFDASFGEQATTRTDPVDLYPVENSFSVFAYYTENGPFNPSTSTPNFMYNQKVEHPDSKWVYTPLKYWPNDYNLGAVDNQTPPATGTKNDKLSFFAYAPHVELEKENGSFVTYEGDANAFKTTNSSGVVAISKNSYVGNPYLIYSQGEGVNDLLFSKELDRIKQDISGKVNFGFTYALARFNILVTGIYDEVTASNNNINSNNKNTEDAAQYGADNYIKVESISIKLSYYDEGSSSYKPSLKKARLYLSADPSDGSTWWAPIAGSEQAEVGVSSDNIAGNLRWLGDETSDNISYGVGRYYITDTEDPKYANNNKPIPADEDESYRYQCLTSEGDYVYFIPYDKTQLKFTIKYHVFTKDGRMFNGLSHVVNEVTSKDVVGERDSEEDIRFSDVEPGKTYTIKMALGLTTVKMTVDESSREFWHSNQDETSNGDNNKNPYKIP